MISGKTLRAQIPPAALDRRDAALAGLLLLAVALVYGQVASHEFVAWDDTSYVSENEFVRQGLSWGNVVWAFSTFQLANWHPLTLLSHMLDVSLWGLDAGAHALTNVVLHGANVLLLYVFLRWTTSARLPSALVAALFAVHPLHVESVAWISERKDVLCAFFWLLAMLAYAHYARRPGVGRYLLVTLAAVFALLAKPMAVTLPFALLLLDVWPFRRIGDWSGLLPILAEKLSWFLFAAAVGIATLGAQSAAMPAFDLVDRLGIAVGSYGWYLEKTFWPSGLHFYYLAEESWHWPRFLFGLVAVCGFSILAWRQRGVRPYLAFGWAWFVLTLLPVAGVVKVGTQAYADRYAYLPHIGLFVMLAFALAELRADALRRAALAASVAAILVLAFLGGRQAAVWRDTPTLYRHALANDPAHYVALMGMANASLRNRDYAAAERYAERALALSRGPSLVRSMRIALGEVALSRGNTSMAVQHFQAATRAEPDDAMAYLKLGVIFLRQGDGVQAEHAFRQAQQRAPSDLAALNGIGAALGVQGRFAESVASLSEGVRRAPWHIDLHMNLAISAERAGDLDRARGAYRSVLRLQPGHEEARRGLSALGG